MEKKKKTAFSFYSDTPHLARRRRSQYWENKYLIIIFEKKEEKRVNSQIKERIRKIENHKLDSALGLKQGKEKTLALAVKQGKEKTSGWLCKARGFSKTHACISKSFGPNPLTFSTLLYCLLAPGSIVSLSFFCFFGISYIISRVEGWKPLSPNLIPVFKNYLLTENKKKLFNGKKFIVF